MLVYMGLLGGLRSLFGDGVGIGFFLVASLVITAGWWTFTAWFLLLGQVRWRVLIPSGIVTGITMGAYALSATIWMPEVITRNETQFGFFGVALALVTWFSGAAICIMIGACVGPVLAEDRGPIGAYVRGRRSELLIKGAPPSLPPPDRGLRLRDAFSPAPEDVTPR